MMFRKHPADRQTDLRRCGDVHDRSLAYGLVDFISRNALASGSRP